MSSFVLAVSVAPESIGTETLDLPQETAVYGPSAIDVKEKSDPQQNKVNVLVDEEHVVSETILTEEELNKIAEEQEQKRLQKIKTDFEENFKPDLKSLENMLYDQNYGSSLRFLQSLTTKIKLKQNDAIKRFFPGSYLEFSVKDSLVPFSDSGIEEADYDVFFNQLYENKDGHSIKINIIQSQELIGDYLELVKRPSLIRNMEDTELIKMGKYTAILTVSDSNKMNEQTILLNNLFMMTIISIGSNQETIIQDFLATIDVLSLENYLNRN